MTLSDQPNEQEPIEPDSVPVKHDPYAAFRSRPYRLFAGAFVFSTIAFQMISATVAWEVYEQTHDPGMLAWIGIVQAVPMLLLSLPAGQVADWFPRKRILMCALSIALMSSCVLAGMALSGHLTPWVIYGVLLINAIASTFGRPARASIIPALVPPQHFSNAVTWNSTMFELLGVIGPSIAGMFLAYFNPAIALSAAVGFLIVGVILTAILPNFHVASQREPVSFSQFIAGVKFVFQTRLMLAAMTLDLFAVLLGGATFLLPIFAKNLGVGAIGFAWLRAAPPIGAIMMAITLAHLPPMKNAGRTLLLAVTGFGLATIVFGFSHWFWLSFAALVACGVCDNISVVIRHTLVQSLTPDSMRGRVSAVNQIFIGSSNEIGGVESSLTAKWFGPVASVVGGGIGTIMVVAIVNHIFPQVRKLKSLHNLRSHGETNPAATS